MNYQAIIVDVDPYRKMISQGGYMRIGAYQYSVTGDLSENYASIKRGIKKKEKMGVRLLVFPECAVTGYPPYCIKSSSDIDFDAADHIL